MRASLFALVFLLIVAAANAQVALPAPAIGSVPAWGIEGASPSMPILTTPVVSLTPVSSAPVGATNATAGLVAGANDSTLNNVPGPTSAVTMQPQFLTSLNLSQETYDLEGGTSPESARRSELGIAQISSAFTGAAEPADLAETARTFRQTRPTHRPRTYTNEDINRIQQAPSTPLPPLQQVQPPAPAPQS